MNNQKNGGEADQNSTGQTGGTRREFLGKITKSLIGGGILITALATPRVAKASGCTECDTNYNECEGDTCDVSNVCGWNTCNYTDTCTATNTCSSNNTCNSTNTCNSDTCVTANSCESNTCSSSDLCTATTDYCVTDIATETGTCEQFDVCSELNQGCFPNHNTHTCGVYNVCYQLNQCGTDVCEMDDWSAWPNSGCYWENTCVHSNN
jgi:hypothetical protein